MVSSWLITLHFFFCFALDVHFIQWEKERKKERTQDWANRWVVFVFVFPLSSLLSKPKPKPQKKKKKKKDRVVDSCTKPASQSGKKKEKKRKKKKHLDGRDLKERKKKIRVNRNMCD